MASVALALEQASSRSEKLWWESHTKLWEDFDEFSAGLCDENVAPERLVQKESEMEQRLRRQRHWLLNMLLCFKPPSSDSRDALNASKIVIGSNTIQVTPELKKAAFRISKHLDLDEIQSLCLLKQVLDEGSSDISAVGDAWLMQNVTLAYFLDRQCLIKCTRYLLTFLSGDGPLSKMVKEFIDTGLENKILENVKKILSSTQPHRWDPVYAQPWADGIAFEQAFLMDMMFNAYHGSLFVCKGSKWKELFQTFQELVFEVRSGEGLAVTLVAEKLVGFVRSQALLILIATLDLRVLVNLVQGGVAFSEGAHGFSLAELQELDSLMSNLDLSVSSVYAPLLLAWATFLCLVAALPDQAMVLDIEHAVYAQQAFKSGANGFLLDMLRSEPFKDFDFQITGYKGAVRTLTSACLAAYDFISQADPATNDQLVEVISEAYDGQEILCVEFWDKENNVDGPIRNFLCDLRKEFPYKMLGLLRMMKSLAYGSWPAQCVYNFLLKSSPVTCLYRPNEGDVYGSNVHISSAIQIPNCSGLYIPAGAAGKVISRYPNGVVLVRWECEHSSLLMLLAYLSRWITETTEEVVSTVALLNRILSCKKDISHLLLDLEKSPTVAIARMDGRMDKLLSLDVIGIVSSAIRNLTANSSDFQTIAETINVLRQFIDCYPGVVVTNFEKTQLIPGTLSGVRFPKLEQSYGRYSVTVAVLEIVQALLEKGVRTEVLTYFVLYVTSNVLVNHGNWKYKERHERWVLSRKIFEVLRSALGSRIWYPDDLRRVVFDTIAKDPIIHGVLLYMLTINSQGLEELFYNRLYTVAEIESLLQAILAALELVDLMLLHILDDRNPKDSATISTFCLSLFQSSSASTSFISIIASYMGFSRYTELQAVSLRVLGRLCVIGQNAKPQSINVGSYISSSEARKRMRKTLENLLSENRAFESPLLFDATVDFLDTVVKSQPPMAELLLFPWDYEADNRIPSNAPRTAKTSAEVLDALWKFVSAPYNPSKRHIEITSCVLNLLSSIWQGTADYINIIQVLRSYEGFWDAVTSFATNKAQQRSQELPSQEEAQVRGCCYRCQASVYQIMVHDMFIQDNLLQSNEGDDSGPRKKMLDWSASGDVDAILRSYGTSEFREEFLLRCKAEGRTFVLGLLVKLIAGNDRGLDVSLIKRLSDFSSQIKLHPSFRELVSQYGSRGYRFNDSLELLVMTDLYYNLQGELEGRKPSPCFQELSLFLEEIDLDTALAPVAFAITSYNKEALRNALGVSCWAQDDQGISIKAADKFLYDTDVAFGVTTLGRLQLSAIDAFSDLLKVFSARRRASSRGFWSTALLISSTDEICNGLERVAAAEPVLYLPRFLLSQSKLLFVIAWQFSTSLDDSRSLDPTLVRAVRTIFGCLTFICSSRNAEAGAVRNLFGSLILSLEAMSRGAELPTGFLSGLCGMADDKNYASLALAAINVIIRVHLVPSTWLPVVQTAFPAKSVIARMAGTESDEKTCGVVMRLCLFLSRFKTAAEMLFGSNLIHYLLVVREPPSDATTTAIPLEGPFSASGGASQPSLWALAVAIIASLLRTLGENEVYRRYVLESAVAYIKAERHRILSALSAPNVVHTSFRSIRTYKVQQRPQTTSASLQETCYVSALLCELVLHQTETLHSIRDDLVQVREMVVHLLAYIAREGLVRAAAVTEGVSCPPLQRQEILAHARPSTMGTTSAWFLISARGSAVKSRPTSTAGTEVVPATTAAASHSEYSESIAVQVYKIVSLLLRFLSTQARQAVQDMERGRPKGFPELPAPEVLHALQDQAITVVSEIAKSNAGKALAPEVLDTCYLLLSVLEQSLYLEACISRMYGISPVSLRADDFVREYKGLISAAKAHDALEARLSSLHEVASFVYNVFNANAV